MTTAPQSPRWTSTTKLIAGFTLVAIVALALQTFQAFLPPLIITFLLVYLLYPVVNFFKDKLHIGWGLAVGFVYLVFLILILGLATISGFELVSQVQSLIKIIESSLEGLPGLMQEISEIEIVIGTFVFDMSALDLNTLSRQLLDTSSAILSRSGDLLSVVAGTALSSLLWGLFILIASFFILIESRGLPEGILHINAYDYAEDLTRMKIELGNIWNSFFRGQLIVIGAAVIVYAILLNVLGVRYAFGLALLIGSARFFPYVGAGIGWTTLILVTFFQASKPFGLSDFSYVGIVFGLSFVLDVVIDYFVYPRIMSNALKVHPAGVLFSAIIGINLLGILGVILAAPMLATLQLFGRYVVRKLFDVDPWEGLEQQKSSTIPLREQIENWRLKLGEIGHKIRKKFGK